MGIRSYCVEASATYFSSEDRLCDSCLTTHRCALSSTLRDSPRHGGIGFIPSIPAGRCLTCSQMLVPRYSHRASSEHRKRWVQPRTAISGQGQPPLGTAVMARHPPTPASPTLPLFLAPICLPRGTRDMNTSSLVLI